MAGYLSLSKRSQRPTYICQEHEKCVRFYLITASKGHNLPLFALSNYLKVTFLCLIDEKLFCLRWRNQIKYLYAIWSSLHPFIQAAHCAIKVLPAVVGPYSTGRLKCLSSSIHFEYRLMPYMELQARMAGPIFSWRMPSALSRSKRRAEVPVGMLMLWTKSSFGPFYWHKSPLSHISGQSMG